MSDEWEKYVNDSRTVCKYGIKCYQKNPDHHKTYKHPPQKNNKHRNRNKRKCEPYPQHRLNKEESKPQDTVCKELDQRESNVSKTEDSKLVLPETLSYYDFDVSSNPKIFEELFLVEMPDDFFKFYHCFSNEDKSIQNTLDKVNLELIGPYDLLIGRLPMLENKELYLTHWRFFFDPPEFQAVLKRKNSEYHIGYFRDAPKDKPVFLAHNDSAENCHITPMADNIFGAVYLYLQNEKKKSPFSAVLCQKLMNKIKLCAEENKYSLEEYPMRKRLYHTVTKSFHGAGILVPYDKKTQLGYRKLIETDSDLKKLFDSLQKATTQSEKDKILSDIQPVITYANIAVDECDFGTGLEIGIDLFCSGLKELEQNALSVLSTTYKLLNRTAFSSIIQVHLKHRRRGSQMSMLSLYESTE